MDQQRDARRRTPEPVIITVDTEYTEISGGVSQTYKVQRVRTLDMSFYAIIPDTISSNPPKEFGGCYSILGGDRLKHLHETSPETDPRPSLGAIVADILEIAEAGLGTQLSGNGRVRQDPKNRQQKTTREIYNVILATHFGRADLSGFGDWPDWKRGVDTVRRNYCSINAPLQINTFVGSRAARLSITFRDTHLLAGGSLDDIGRTLGIPKIDIEAQGFTKDRMDLLKLMNPNLYTDYAIQDAKITAKYIHELYYGTLPKLGIDPRHKPATSSAIGWRIVQNDWKRAGHDSNKLLGFERVKRPNNEGYSRELIPNLLTHAWKAVESYQGGRNEALLCGCSWAPEGSLWRDIDIASAYSTAMCNIREADWQGIQETKDLNKLADLGQRGIAIALIEFRCPSNVKHPPLPVRAGDAGLFFPHNGVAWATGPELWLARQLGVVMTVKDGLFVPWTETAFYPFAETMRKGNAMRKQAQGAQGGAKDPNLDKTIKLALNSIYGKSGQSVSELGNKSLDFIGNASTKSRYKVKSGYDSRSMEYKDIPISKLTQPWFASYTTGLVRATLCEIMNNISDGELIANAVTDGVCTTQDLTTIPMGGVGQFMLDARKRQGLSGGLLEPKGRSRGILSAKTRCCVSLGRTPLGDKTMHAMGPLSPVRDLPHKDPPAGYSKDKWASVRRDRRNRMLVRMGHRNRGSGSTIKSKVAMSIADQHRTNSDFVLKETEKRLQMDWDGKREPILETARDVHGVVYFETRAWDKVEDAIAWRKDLTAWRDVFEQVLKTRQDLLDFTAWRQAGCQIPETTVIKPKNRKKLTLVDHLARAWPHINGGTNKGVEFTYDDIARELTDLGIRTTPNSFKQRVKRAVKARLNGIPAEPLNLDLDQKAIVGRISMRLKPINLKWMLLD